MEELMEQLKGNARLFTITSSARASTVAGISRPRAAGWPLAARAQVYPSRPITIVVPYPAGGPTDTLARILADHMRTSLGQPVIIENVSGGGGSAGVGRVARAVPDGYTVSIGHWNTHVVPGATLNIPYDVPAGSRDRRSATGTADTRRAGSKLWWMASRDRGGSGTKSLTRSKRRSSIWPLRSRTCRRVSSPSTSQTQRAALCQKPPFIGS